MYLAPLAYALQARGYGSMLRRAYRTRIVGDCRHLITIEYDPNSFGYRLSRIVFETRHESVFWYQIKKVDQVRDFQYITELFTTAKQEGFFEDVLPYATNWQGFTSTKPDDKDSKNYSYTDYDKKEEESPILYYDPNRGEFDEDWVDPGIHEVISNIDGHSDGYQGYEFDISEPANLVNDNEVYYDDEQYYYEGPENVE